MNEKNIQIESYEGKEPYLFVSYSHYDVDYVNKILLKLDEEKFRLWYDDTMEIGEDFRTELVEKIENCCGILLFISNHSMKSKYCGMEIITAYKNNKRIYPIYIEKTAEIPEVLRMIFDNLQHVKAEYVDQDKYLNKLISSLPNEAVKSLKIKDGVLIKCKDGSPNIKLTNDVIHIDKKAFRNCENLEEISLGSSVRSIGSEGFRGCKKLKEIYIPAIVKKIGESTFRDCIGLKKVEVVCSEIEIGERAFENCASLEEIHLPRGMAEIYGGVFNSCKSLVNINLPQELTILGESSFADCIKLKEIIIPDSVTKIDDMAFNGCLGLEKMILNNSISKIGKNAFKDCVSLKEIYLPASLILLGTSPFRGCMSLEKIQVDPKNKSYKSVDDILFSKSKSNLVCFPACSDKTTYEIPDSVTEISDWAFCDCQKLQEIKIPDSVHSIGEGAFYRCTNLETIIIPDSVVRIDDVAFRDCISLKKLVIPNSVIEFGWGVLNGCEHVQVVCSSTSQAAQYCERKNIPHSEK